MKAFTMTETVILVLGAALAIFMVDIAHAAEPASPTAETAQQSIKKVNKLTVQQLTQQLTAAEAQKTLETGCGKHSDATPPFTDNELKTMVVIGVVRPDMIGKLCRAYLGRKSI